jgi:K+-sensing histidine kinase KdpD
MTDGSSASSPIDAKDPYVTLLHDLRTPLAIVSGFAELLAKNETSLSPEQRHDYVTRIAAAAQDMRNLLDAERKRRRGV